MKILFIILILLLSGCATYPRFNPSGESGSKVEYFWAKKTCDYCHKQCGFFKIVNRKKIICADCYENRYMGIKRK